MADTYGCTCPDTNTRAASCRLHGATFTPGGVQPDPSSGQDLDPLVEALIIIEAHARDCDVCQRSTEFIADTARAALAHREGGTDGS